MSDETDLDILNNSMEVMVDQFQTELLPVAAMLTARLVGNQFDVLLNFPCCSLIHFISFLVFQCESYMRLARESAIQDHLEENADLDTLLNDVDDDKTFAAMGVAKTISTVCGHLCLSYSQVIADDGVFSADYFLNRQLSRNLVSDSGNRCSDYCLYP